MKFKFFFVVFLVCALTAMGQTEQACRNGTYIGAFDRYEKSKKAYITDTEYVSIRFINDSLFVFTLAGGAIAGHELRFNYNPVSGIGRLVRFHGSKVWVGLLDLGQGAGFFDRDDEQFCNVDSVLSIQQALDTIPPVFYPYNQYNLLRFTFQGSDRIDLKIIKKVAGRFQLAASFTKLDCRDFSFRIGPDFHLVSQTGQYYGDDDSAVMSESSALKLFPVEENISPYLNGRLKKGDKIFLGTRYMKYVFIYQLDDNHHYRNYGWVKRSAIAPLKKSVP